MLWVRFILRSNAKVGLSGISFTILFGTSIWIIKLLRQNPHCSNENDPGLFVLFPSCQLPHIAGRRTRWTQGKKNRGDLMNKTHICPQSTSTWWEETTAFFFWMMVNHCCFVDSQMASKLNIFRVPWLQGIESGEFHQFLTILPMLHWLRPGLTSCSSWLTCADPNA